jgi:hypothetical protein
MHRSLFQRAFSTEIVYVLKLFPDLLLKLVSRVFRSIKLPRDTPGIPQPNPQYRAARENVETSIHFASGAQSNGAVTTNAHIPGLVHENVEAKIGYQMA